MGLEENFAKPGSGRFTVQFRSGKGHAVFAPDGTQVGGWYESRAQARVSCTAKQRAADEAAKRIERPCMCCRAPFQSQGIHNRLCKTCRAQRDVLGDPHRPYITSR